MAVERAIVIAKMRQAITKGMSASKFILQMRQQGLGYRRTTMLSDWREVGNIKKKEGAARFIRKGYVPAANTIELHAWNMSREYMYRVITERVGLTGEKLESKFINIMSDKRLTVSEITREAFVRAFDQSPPEEGEERRFILESVIRRVEE